MTGDPQISRPSFFVAGLLGIVGLARVGVDHLTDLNPTWSEALGHSWERYFVRAASDGTRLGDLDVQFFKVLAVPCGLGVAYYLHLLAVGGLEAADRSWRTWRMRLLYVGALLALCTLLEVEKASHLLGLGLAGLLPGEVAWKNHLVHLVGAAIGWQLTGWLRYTSGATTRGPSKGATSSP